MLFFIIIIFILFFFCGVLERVLCCFDGMGEGLFFILVVLFFVFWMVLVVLELFFLFNNVVSLVREKCFFCNCFLSFLVIFLSWDFKELINGDRCFFCRFCSNWFCKIFIFLWLFSFLWVLFKVLVVWLW